MEKQICAMCVLSVGGGEEMRSSKDKVREERGEQFV